MQRVILWIVFVLAVIIVVGGVVVAVKNQGQGNVGQTYSINVEANDWVENASAVAGQATVTPLTLVEYSDFQCPACGAYFPVIKQLRLEYATSTRFVYRNFPLPQHRNAKAAAYAAGAAGLQGKFFAMHDILFLHQNDWSDLSDPSATFVSYAQAIGLDVNKFKTDTASQAVRDKIQHDMDTANQYNIDATPTFFLNGQRLVNPSGLEPFKVILDTALKNRN